MAEDLTQFIPHDILAKYEIFSYRYAATVLHTGCKPEFDELIDALRNLWITVDDIRTPGGNESEIPKHVSRQLRPRGWVEARITADLHVQVHANPNKSGAGGLIESESIRPGFIDGHQVDYYKNDVAFDVEWNSKDQTFDRDLYAMRAFHDTGLISAGVLLTRSAALNEVFELLGPELHGDGTPKTDSKGKPKMLRSKYGASTTWMGKLLYRIEAGRNGGCPILAIGITKACISDWEDWLNGNAG